MELQIEKISNGVVEVSIVEFKIIFTCGEAMQANGS